MTMAGDACFRRNGHTRKDLVTMQRDGGTDRRTARPVVLDEF